MLYRLTGLLIMFAPLSLAQTLSTPILLTKSLRASTNGMRINDVRIDGTVHRVSGADHETGALVAQAVSTGEARVDYNYNSGRRSESRAVSASTAEERFTAQDGSKHRVVSHNVPPLSPWFSPALLLQSVVDDNAQALPRGSEMREGKTVEHITISSQVPALHHPKLMLTLLQKAARVEVYLDATTHLPMSIAYNAHPDRNLAQDIPVEIRYSDYRLTNGVLVPFHIEKYFNGTRELDIRVTSTAINSGVSAGSLQIQ